MTPLPPPLGDGALMAWRLDKARFARTWDSGEGAFHYGGRWNSPGVRAVYCALDPATALLEVAVHAGFATIDVVPHVLTGLRLRDAAAVQVIPPEAVPEAAWLSVGDPGRAQQAFGDALLAAHRFVALPSTVSRHSWNLIFAPGAADGYAVTLQEPFMLDPRLHAPAAAGKPGQDAPE